MKIHKGKHKDNHKGLICNFCDYTTTHSIKEHERTHTGKNQKFASFSKRIYIKKALMQHERIHTGEKPFKCMFCEMSSAQRNIFNIHAKNYTKDTLETAKLYEYQKQNN